jgi:hypothetical protein
MLLLLSHEFAGHFGIPKAVRKHPCATRRAGLTLVPQFVSCSQLGEDGEGFRPWGGPKLLFATGADPLDIFCGILKDTYPSPRRPTAVRATALS